MQQNGRKIHEHRPSASQTCCWVPAGDQIWVEEKLDGSNFSLFYDENPDQLRAFGRKTELDEKNNLRGAWEWVQKLDKDKVKSVLGSRYLLFGEWLVKHAVPYPEERYNQMYCFDAMDLETGKYLPQEQVMEMVEKLGLTYVPVFYQGPFQNWEQIEAMVGKTALGGEYGEGVVVKNMSRLNDPNEKLPFYTKIVGENFAEKRESHARMWVMFLRAQSGRNWRIRSWL